MRLTENISVSQEKAKELKAGTKTAFKKWLKSKGAGAGRNKKTQKQIIEKAYDKLKYFRVKE